MDSISEKEKSQGKKLGFYQGVKPFEDGEPMLSGKWQSENYQLEDVGDVVFEATPSLQTRGTVDVTNFKKPVMVAVNLSFHKEFDPGKRLRWITKSYLKLTTNDGSTLWAMPESVGEETDEPISKLRFTQWQPDRAETTIKGDKWHRPQNPVLEENSKVPNLKFEFEKP